MTSDLVADRAAATAPVSVAGAAQHAPRFGMGGLFATVLGLVGWIVGSGRLSDNSFFWHLRTGEWILDHGMPRGDVFSYTAPGTKWVAQSWLAEVTYAVLERGFGSSALRIFTGLIGVAIAVVAYRLALRLAVSPGRSFALTLVALLGPFALWSARPLVLGVLCFLVLLWIVEIPTSRVGRHALFVLPVLMWVWANLHGSFALGFAYLGLHLVGRWVEGARPWQGRERTLATAGVIGFALCFVNPYGAALVTFPVELLSRGDVLSHVIEWQSPSFRSPWGLALALWIAVFVVVVARASHRITRRDLIVALPFLLMGLWATRNIAVATLVGLPIAARAIAVDREPTSRYPARFLIALSAVIVLVGGVVALASTGEPAFDLRSYPVASIRYLERHDLLGERLLTDDADAGYVILDHFPEQRVFMDDRYDMFPLGVIDDYLELSAGDPGWERALDRRDVDLVVWDRTSPLASLLDGSPEWTRVRRDRDFGIWVREGSDAAARASSA